MDTAPASLEASPPPQGFSLLKFVEQIPELMSWIWLLRVPVLGIVALEGLAFASDQSLIRGAFEVNDQTTLFFISFSVFFFVWAMRMICSLTARYGPERFGVGRLTLPGSMPKLALDGTGVFLWSLVGIYPLVKCWAIGHVTESDSLPGSLKWIPDAFVPVLPWLMMIAGWLAAYVIFAAVVYFQRMGEPPGRARAGNGQVFDLWWPGRFLTKLYERAQRHPPGLFKSLAKGCHWLLGMIPPELGRGFMEYEGKKVTEIKPGIIAAMVASVFGTVVFWSLRGIDAQWIEPLPALFYVVWLFTVVCWYLGVIAFFLDRWRLPSVGIFVVVLCIVGHINPLDYTFVARRTDARAPCAGEILAQRLESAPEPANPRLILVAAEGGGIHSGTWVNHVLGKLQRMSLGPDGKGKPSLKDSIILVSGVSGGSYGLMYWLDSYSPDYPCGSVFSPRDHAQRDSLSSAVKGLVYRDLWINSLPKFLLGNDRGTAIQTRWADANDSRKRLDQILLSDWAADARAGKRPAALFNSTSQETGLPVVFGTATFGAVPLMPHKGEDEREFRNRRQIADNKTDAGDWWLDTTVATAARLSSSFPWVLPMARPEMAAGGDANAVNPQHLADGGYFDNFGMASLTRWLDGAIQAYSDSHPRPLAKPLEVLVVQIWDGPTTEQKAGDTRPTDHGFAFQAVAPMDLLINQRSYSHSQRDAQEYNLLCDKWKDCGVANINTACFEFPYDDGALSWHLTREQVKQITDIPIAAGEIDPDTQLPCGDMLARALKSHPGSIDVPPYHARRETPDQVLAYCREKLQHRLKLLNDSTTAVLNYLHNGQSKP